jgi:hypothetical protein
VSTTGALALAAIVTGLTGLEFPRHHGWSKVFAMPRVPSGKTSSRALHLGSAKAVRGDATQGSF